MVAVHPNRYTHHLIKKGGVFALHILYDTQSELVSRFKGPAPKHKFSGLDWATGKTNCPILSDCLAYLECELKTHYRPGNHSLFVGKVLAAGGSAEGSPLTTMDYDGVYVGKS